MRRIATGTGSPSTPVMTPSRSRSGSPSLVSPRASGDTRSISIHSRWSSTSRSRRLSSALRRERLSGRSRYCAAWPYLCSLASWRYDCTEARGDSGDVGGSRRAAESAVSLPPVGRRRPNCACAGGAKADMSAIATANASASALGSDTGRPRLPGLGMRWAARDPPGRPKAAGQPTGRARRARRRPTLSGEAGGEPALEFVIESVSVRVEAGRAILRRRRHLCRSRCRSRWCATVRAPMPPPTTHRSGPDRRPAARVRGRGSRPHTWRACMRTLAAEGSGPAPHADGSGQ